MHRPTQEDKKEMNIGRNVRLRSKLSLIATRKAGMARKLIERQANSIVEEAQEEQQAKWSERRFVNVGKSFHGLSNVECRRLQKKAAGFYSLHQLLELKSTQMSKSYLEESKRICFDSIDVQLKKIDYHTFKKLARQGSLPLAFGIDGRLAKLDLKDRPQSELAGQFKLCHGDFAFNASAWIGIGAGMHTPKYHGSVHTFSVASKTSSLPTITADDSEEEEGQFEG